MFGRRYWGSGTRSNGSVASGFYAGVLATLKADPVLVQAIGDTPFSPKFHADVAVSVELPWLIFSEVTSDPEYSSDGSYIESGTFQVAVTAGSRSQAKRIGDLVQNVLDDANITFDDGQLLRLRHGKRHSDAVKEPGKGGVTVYYLQVTEYDFMISRNL